MPKKWCFRLFFACRRHGGDDSALLYLKKPSKMNVLGGNRLFEEVNMSFLAHVCPFLWAVSCLLTGTETGFEFLIRSKRRGFRCSVVAVCLLTS